MRLARALAYWLGALFLVALPVLWLPTKGFNEVTFATIALTPDVAYRDLAVLILAVLGVAIFDAFEAARLNLSDGIRMLAVTVFLVLLVLDFAACSISYGLAVGSSHELSPRLPGWFFWQAVLLSLLAKISAVVSDTGAKR